MRQIIYLMVLAMGMANAGYSQTPIPVGDEFQLNTSMVSSQYEPFIASDGSDQYVAVWIDGNIRHIVGRRFDSMAAPIGEEFLVSSYAPLTKEDPIVEVLENGDFVVAWMSENPYYVDNDYGSIQGRRFNSSGIELGEQFQVNTYSTLDQSWPGLSQDGSGGFVVVWESLTPDGSDSSNSVLAQRFSSNGIEVGGEFQINSYTTSFQLEPSVALDGSGGFVVTWVSNGSYGSDSDERSIQAQRFGSDGSLVGSEFQVNTYTLEDQFYPVVEALGGSGFAVVWMSDRSPGSDSSGASIQARVFDSYGSAKGEQFQVNTFTSNSQYSPAIKSLASGEFIVSWHDLPLGDINAIRIQRFHSNGTANGTEFIVNTYTSAYQAYSSIGSMGSNEFVVVWTGVSDVGPDMYDASVRGQRFVLPEIFADGFESGDTTAWSSSMP